MTGYDWDKAHEALESMDAYARMDKGVNPYGPYTVLRDLLTKAKAWEEAALRAQPDAGASQPAGVGEPQGVGDAVAWAAVDTRGAVIEVFMTEAGALQWRDWQDDQDPSLRFDKAMPLYAAPVAQSREGESLTDVERKAVTDLMEMQEYECDTDDEPPSIDDEGVYWAYHNYHGLRKLLATSQEKAS